MYVLETKMQRMLWRRCVRWALNRGRRGTARADSCEIISTAEELQKMQLNKTDKPIEYPRISGAGILDYFTRQSIVRSILSGGVD